MKIEERRKHKRYKFAYPIKFGIMESDLLYSSFCVNISRGGLLIKSPQKYNINQMLQIVFSFTINGNSNVLKLQAQIVWIKEIPKENIYNLGAKFINLSSENIENLEKFINEFCKKSDDLDIHSLPKDSREFFIRGIKKYNDDVEGAIEDFTKAIELDSSHAAAYYYRAFAKDRINDSAGAEQDFIKSKELGKF